MRVRERFAREGTGTPHGTALGGRGVRGIPIVVKHGEVLVSGGVHCGGCKEVRVDQREELLGCLELGWDEEKEGPSLGGIYTAKSWRSLNKSVTTAWYWGRLV